jgi:pimeloyl-ACP methyl ester carboxylesterase
MVSKVCGIELERRGGGEPLLLIHGTGCARSVWKPLHGPLGSSRELLIVDLPGHGGSGPPPDGIAHNPIGYAEVLGSMFDELGLESVDVAGNSVGGWTALELAKIGRARSVVALDPAGLWLKRDPWGATFQLWSQYKLGQVFAPITRRLLRSSTGRTLLMSGTVGRPAQMPAADAIEMAETYARTPEFKEHLRATRRARFEGGGGIEVPVTVAWGEKDRLIPKKARLTRELPSRTRVVTLPGCGHVPMWDDPELVSRTILEGAEGG